MPEINDLNSIQEPQQDDLLPVFSRRNGAARKLSFGNLVAWLARARKNYNVRTPIGSTINVNGSGDWFMLPAGNFTMNISGFYHDGDEVFLTSDGGSRVSSPDVNSGGVTLASGETARLLYVSNMQRWYKV